MELWWTRYHREPEFIFGLDYFHTPPPLSSPKFGQAHKKASGTRGVVQSSQGPSSQPQLPPWSLFCLSHSGWSHYLNNKPFPIHLWMCDTTILNIQTKSEWRVDPTYHRATKHEWWCKQGGRPGQWPPLPGDLWSLTLTGSPVCGRHTLWVAVCQLAWALGCIAACWQACILICLRVCCIYRVLLLLQI